MGEVVGVTVGDTVGEEVGEEDGLSHLPQTSQASGQQSPLPTHCSSQKQLPTMHSPPSSQTSQTPSSSSHGTKAHVFEVSGEHCPENGGTVGALVGDDVGGTTGALLGALVGGAVGGVVGVAVGGSFGTGSMIS